MNKLFLNDENVEIDIYGIIPNPTKEQIADYISLYLPLRDYESCSVEIDGKTLTIHEFYKLLWG